MGKRGGLNILPQKKWNVYNWDNRIKVEQNEKMVDREVEKINLQKRSKRLAEKIEMMRKGIKFFKKEVSETEIDDKEKTKIYMDIMKREQMVKEVLRATNKDNSAKIPSTTTPINFEEIKTPDEIENEIKKRKNEIAPSSTQTRSTIGGELRKNLKSWYSLPRKVD